MINVYAPSPRGVGPLKIAIFEILECTKMAKYINFRAECYQKDALYQKMLQIKVVKGLVW